MKKKNKEEKVPKKDIRGVLPYLDEFLLQLQSNNLSPETVYSYESDLSIFAFFLKNDLQISFAEVTRMVTDKYKAYLNSYDRYTAGGAASEKRLSAISINRILSSLRIYLSYLIDIEYKTPIAPSIIKLLKTPKKHARVAELEVLIQFIESPTHFEKVKKVKLRNRAMLETLFATGMRISELLSLNRDQIDHTGRIFIRGKGRKERFVYLTERAKKCIDEYTDQRTDKYPALFLPYRGRNVGTAKARISPNYLQMKIKQYREKLGINVPTSAHSLRHGFATYLAENGANPAAIQILLGHESLHTTSRYVHASDKYAEKTHHDFHPLNK